VILTLPLVPEGGEIVEDIPGLQSQKIAGVFPELAQIGQVGREGPFIDPLDDPQILFESVENPIASGIHGPDLSS